MSLKMRVSEKLVWDKNKIFCLQKACAEICFSELLCEIYSGTFLKMNHSDTELQSSFFFNLSRAKNNYLDIEICFRAKRIGGQDSSSENKFSLWYFDTTSQ